MVESKTICSYMPMHIVWLGQVHCAGITNEDENYGADAHIQCR